MKKYLSMLAFVAGSFMLASCSGSEAEEEVKNDSKLMTFKISSSSTSGSRAKIDALNLGAACNVVWENGDMISVFGDTNHENHPIRYKENIPDYINGAIFIGEAFESDNYIFIYPYQKNATFDGTTIKATIPPVQKATLNSFDPKAAISGGKAVKDAPSVTLEHACGFFAIETKGDCEYIKIEPVLTSEKPHWYFTGGIELRENSSGSPITIDENTGGKEYVMLTADGKENYTGTFPAGRYLIAVASSTGFPKMKVTVKYSGKNAISSTSTSAVQIEAGSMNSLGTVNVPN